MWQFNEITHIGVEELQSSKIYVIDDFFKNPHDIVSYLTSDTNRPALHKSWEVPSHNNIEFFEGRHRIQHPDILPLQKTLLEICGSSGPASDVMYSNLANFYNREFNDYTNNYWWPHRDSGWNCLIYLNDVEVAGTNLYTETADDQEYIRVHAIKEHHEPWRSRSKYNVIKTLNCKYNRLVMFDGKKFLHGLAMTDDTFFRITRMNVAMFFN
jgi:hypothetical protein